VNVAPLVAGVMLLFVAGIVRIRAWHAALGDACPTHAIRYRDVLAAHLGGAGFNGILPAHGGDGIKLALLKRRFPEAPFGFLLGSLGPPAAIEALCTALLVAWAIATGVIGTPSAGQIPLPLVGLGAVLAAALLWLLARRAPRLLRDVRSGLAPLRRPRLVFAGIAPWVLGARVLRLAGIACFLSAVGLPVTLAALLVVMAVQSGVGSVGPASGAIRVAVLAAALPHVLGTHVAVETATTLLVGTQLIVMAVNFTISLVVLGLTLRTISARRVFGYCRESTRGAAAALAPGVTKP
jgi:hypothetical protein